MPSDDDVDRIRQTLGDRAARRYRSLVDLRQYHLSDFQEGRRR